jgi:hypothetical protein
VLRASDRLTSMSQLGVAMRCGPSAALARAGGTDSLDGEDPAEAGTAKHTFLELLETMTPVEALAKVPESVRSFCAAIPVERIPALAPGRSASEVAFAYHTLNGTSREIGRRIGRRYGEIDPWEIAGSADRAALSADGQSVLVVDWKTGRTRVDPARDNWQLRALCLAAARAWDRPRSIGVIVYLGEDHEPYSDVAVFDEFDLAGFAEDLRAWALRVRRMREDMMRGLAPSFERGRHCRTCPSFDFCPAWHGLLWSLLGEQERAQLAQEVEAGLANGASRVAYERARELKTLAEAVWRRVHEHGWRHTIQLGDGLAFGRTLGAERVTDHHRAFDILADVVGHERAERGGSSSWETSKASMRSVLTERAKEIDVPTARLERQVHDRMRAAGVFRQAEVVKEHRVAPSREPGEDDE